MKATNATNSSSTEADSKSDIPVRTPDLVLGCLFIFGVTSCALFACCISCSSGDSDGLGSQRGRSDQGRTRRPCNNGEDNRSSIEATFRQVDVLDRRFTEAIPVNTGDIPVAIEASSESARRNTAITVATEVDRSLESIL